MCLAIPSLLSSFLLPHALVTQLLARPCSSDQLSNYEIISFRCLLLCDTVQQCDSNPPLHLPEAECDAPEPGTLFQPIQAQPTSIHAIIRNTALLCQNAYPSLLPTCFLIICLLALAVGPVGPCCRLSDPPTSLLPLPRRRSCCAHPLVGPVPARSGHRTLL